ncbi:MAG: hypothetical protein IKF14_07585 [Atopobiaceae bacterium]|nr:hypothetical protein [Atopobiaceae bacterium]
MTEENELDQARSLSTDERLSAIQQANDHVEHLLSQLLMAEEAAKADVVRSAEEEEREQAIEQDLGPVYDPDLEPAEFEEPEVAATMGDVPHGDDGASEPGPLEGPEPLEDSAPPEEQGSFEDSQAVVEPIHVEEPEPFEEPLPLDEPAAPRTTPASRVSALKDQGLAASIPELSMTDLDDASLDEPLDPDARFFKPEVKVNTRHDEVLAAKSHPDRLEVGMSVMDDAASGRTRELRTRKREPKREGFFGTIGAFVAKALHMD